MLWDKQCQQTLLAEVSYWACPSPWPLNLLQEEMITSCWLEMWKDSHPVAEGNWALG